MSQEIQPNSLTPLSQIELDSIIKKHINFVECKNGGARATIKFKSLVGLSFRKKDLTGADFTGCDMRNCDLSDCNFHNGVFYACNMQNSNMARSDFSRADFRGADLTGADMTDANLTKADMRQGAKIIAQDTVTRTKIETLDGKTIFKGTDLENADLSGARASDLDLSSSNLSYARLANIDLSKANLENSNMSHVDLSEANLENARMAGIILSGATLDNTNMQGANLQYALTEKPVGKVFDYSEEEDGPLVKIIKRHGQWVQFEGQKGERADLSGYDMRNIHDLVRYSLTAIKAENAIFQGMALLSAQMQSCDFSGSDFRDVKFIGADLRASKFIGAKMSRVNLSKANLSSLTLSKDKKLISDLTDADLSFSDCSGCNFQNAILIRVNFEGANLEGADLRGADIAGANLENTKIERIRK